MLFSVCLVFDAYEKNTEMSIEDSIKNELSGDFERLMLAVGKSHAESAALWRHGEFQFNTRLSSCFIFSHSPVHKERSHVLCQAALQVNEGKYTASKNSHSVWFPTICTQLCLSSHYNALLLLSDRLRSNVLIGHLKWISTAYSCLNVLTLNTCPSFPGSRYSWQHPDQDHDFSLWNRHVGHSRVFLFEIREVTL